MELNIGSIYGFKHQTEFTGFVCLRKTWKFDNTSARKICLWRKGTSTPGDREIACRNGGKCRNRDCFTGQAARPHGTGPKDYSDQRECCHIRHGREWHCHKRPQVWVHYILYTIALHFLFNFSLNQRFNCLPVAQKLSKESIANEKIWIYGMFLHNV